MPSRVGVNIFGHYIVAIKSMPFHICILKSKILKCRTKSYLIYFFNPTTIRRGVVIWGGIELVPTAVSSN